MAAVTRELAAFTAAIRYESLPAEVQERTRFLVLDLVGNMLTNSKVGTYTYPAQGASSVRPHAVTGISGARAGRPVLHLRRQRHHALPRYGRAISQSFALIVLSLFFRT